MRAVCIAQRVVAIRYQVRSEVVHPRRGSNPAGQNLGQKPSTARRDFRPTDQFAPPSISRCYHFTKRTPYGGISIRPFTFFCSSKSKTGCLKVTGWFVFVKFRRKQNSS